MEIKVTVEASPELLSAIDTLTATLVELVSQRAKATAAGNEPEIHFRIGTVPAEAETKNTDKPAQNITLETVRAKLAALSQSGKQAEVKALINSYGVAKLTEIPAEKYPEVLEKAEALS